MPKGDKQRKITKVSINKEIKKTNRLHAWVTSTEKADAVTLSVLFNCTVQDVLREGLKQLYENTVGIITREKF